MNQVAEKVAADSGDVRSYDPGNRRIPELDGLRGLAILLVIICHYVAGASHPPLGFVADHLITILDLGWSGVDLFFVLSGFLIGGILLGSRNSPNYFRTFYLRRAHRILPVYYSWILLYVVFVSISVYSSLKPVILAPPLRVAVVRRDMVSCRGGAVLPHCAAAHSLGIAAHSSCHTLYDGYCRACSSLHNFCLFPATRSLRSVFHALPRGCALLGHPRRDCLAVERCSLLSPAQSRVPAKVHGLPCRMHHRSALVAGSSPQRRRCNCRIFCPRFLLRFPAAARSFPNQFFRRPLHANFAAAPAWVNFVLCLHHPYDHQRTRASICDAPGARP